MIELRIIRPDGTVSTVVVKPDPTSNLVDRIRELLRRVRNESTTQTPPPDDGDLPPAG